MVDHFPPIFKDLHMTLGTLVRHLSTMLTNIQVPFNSRQGTSTGSLIHITTFSFHSQAPDVRLLNKKIK